jgi:uncharacterized protein YndB with AHSA1/START domain
MAKEIRLSTWIAAPAAKVWMAMEREEFIQRWLSKGARWEGRLGGQVRVYDNSGEYEMGGTISVWEPGRRVVFGWAQFKPHPHAETRCTIELTPEGEGTRVTLVHDQFEGISDEEFQGYVQGWGDGSGTFTRLQNVVAAMA